MIFIKIALLGNSRYNFTRVYTEKVMRKLNSLGEVSPLIGKGDIKDYKEVLADCEVAFSTWGMPKFTEDEIKTYMPKLKLLFYSAGSVQDFARPFLNCGVRVFSAFAANAVPVAEYTFSQIVLATKGFYQSSKRFRIAFVSAMKFANSTPGNFESKIGLVGLGAIGTMVAERLKTLDVEVLAYDPFVSREKAGSLGVKLVSLEELFSQCDVISNHLANKEELNNIFNGKYFNLMKKYSVFINTGRGAQVNEWALAKSLILHPSRTAVLDVLKKEYIPYINPLFWCPNAIITPHIAGSMGKETQRMAYYMLEQFDNYLNNRKMQYEITLEMLSTMA